MEVQEQRGRFTIFLSNMPPKPITYSIKDFRQSISPDLYKSGIARTEHFDTIAGQARQWHEIEASTVSAYGSSNTGSALNSYTRLGSILYALGMSDSNHPAIFYWDYGTESWLGIQEFATGAAANCLFSYHGNLYGYYNGTHIFKCTTGGSATPEHYNITDYTTFAYPIVHSKDDVAYLFLDNLIYTFDGTTATLALTLPSGFKITSACEDGDYIMIVGFDASGKATGYLWDRDSSLSTLSGKYDLGYDIPHHVARLGGNTFIVSARGESVGVASNVPDLAVLTVRLRNGDMADIVSEYQMPAITMPLIGTSYGQGRFANSHRLYFSALAQLKGDSSAKNLVFRLDYNGKLSIALNMGINVQASNCNMTGIYRESDAWFVAGRTDGNWSMTTTHNTVSSFETTIIRSPDLSQDLNLSEVFVTFEPLPTGGSISLLCKKNEETSWTTLKTFTTVGKVKFSITSLAGNNALNGLTNARQLQFRLQISSSGSSPVILTGFQAVLLPVQHDNNG
jgi:hypothetical protein